MISGKSTEPEDGSSGCACATSSVPSSKSFNLSGHAALLFVKQRKECDDLLLVKEGNIS